MTTSDQELADFGKLSPEPMVSVWMITYQQADFVSQAIESVLIQQTDFPFEICIGEDESTDGTREICMEYVKRYPEQIRLFLRSRRNPARFNYIVPYMFNAFETLESCRGKYIALLEGDDYWTDPLKLQKQVRFLEKHPAYSMCFHNRSISNPDEPGSDGERLPSEMLRDLSHTEIAMSMFPTPPTSTVMYKSRAILPLPPWFREMTCGDRALAIIASQRGKCGFIGDIEDSVYRHHAAGVAAGAHAAKRSLMDIKSRSVVLRNVPMSRAARCYNAQQVFELYSKAFQFRKNLTVKECRQMRVGILLHGIRHPLTLMALMARKMICRFEKSLCLHKKNV